MALILRLVCISVILSACNQKEMSSPKDVSTSSVRSVESKEDLGAKEDLPAEVLYKQEIKDAVKSILKDSFIAPNYYFYVKNLPDGVSHHLGDPVHLTRIETLNEFLKTRKTNRQARLASLATYNQKVEAPSLNKPTYFDVFSSTLSLVDVSSARVVTAIECRKVKLDILNSLDTLAMRLTNAYLYVDDGKTCKVNSLLADATSRIHGQVQFNAGAASAADRYGLSIEALAKNRSDRFDWVRPGYFQLDGQVDSIKIDPGMTLTTKNALTKVSDGKYRIREMIHNGGVLDLKVSVPMEVESYTLKETSTLRLNWDKVHSGAVLSADSWLFGKDAKISVDFSAISPSVMGGSKVLICDWKKKTTPNPFVLAKTDLFGASLQEVVSDTQYSVMLTRKVAGLGLDSISSEISSSLLESSESHRLITMPAKEATALLNNARVFSAPLQAHFDHSYKLSNTLFVESQSFGEAVKLGVSLGANEWSFFGDSSSFGANLAYTFDFGRWIGVQGQVSAVDFESTSVYGSVSGHSLVSTLSATMGQRFLIEGGKIEFGAASTLFGRTSDHYVEFGSANAFVSGYTLPHTLEAFGTITCESDGIGISASHSVNNLGKLETSVVINFER